MGWDKSTRQYRSQLSDQFAPPDQSIAIAPLDIRYEYVSLKKSLGKPHLVTAYHKVRPAPPPLGDLEGQLGTTSLTLLTGYQRPCRGFAFVGSVDETSPWQAFHIICLDSYQNIACRGSSIQHLQFSGVSLMLLLGLWYWGRPGPRKNIGSSALESHVWVTVTWYAGTVGFWYDKELENIRACIKCPLLGSAVHSCYVIISSMYVW